MAYDINNTQTLATIKGGNEDVVKITWDKEVERFESQNDFFQGMEGPSPNAIIRTKTNPEASAGGKVVFRNTTGLSNEAHVGEQLFTDGSHFEKRKFSAYELVVGYIRHAVRGTKNIDELSGLTQELHAGTARELGEWLGREKTWRAMMSFLHKGNAENEVFAGGKFDKDNLLSADTVTMDEIITIGAIIRTLGGRPAHLGKDPDGNPIDGGCVLGTTDALLSLQLDPTYKTARNEAFERGKLNPAFRGGYTHINGHVIREFNSTKADWDGVWGSPLNPEERLGVAITAGTAAFDIKGGGDATTAADTRKKVFRFFPNYDFSFTESDTLGAGTAEFYVLVVNPSMPGDADSRKVGFYKCVGNDGNGLTVTQRLGASIGGVAHTTVGGVVWDTGVWEGITTANHPVGAMVYLANSKGVQLGYTLMLYGDAMRRAYGGERRFTGSDQHEAGYVYDTHIRCIMNQVPTKDHRLRCPNFIRLTHALKIPGSPLPTVTA